MASRRFAEPPRWDENTLEANRRDSVADFIAERTSEGKGRYQRVLAENVRLVEALFIQTNNLLSFASGAVLAEDPSFLAISRYLSGPPVSADDLDTLGEAKLAKRKRLDPSLAGKAAQVIASAIDEDRFPWLFADPPRNPTATEREVALKWTAGLQTVQQVQTGRRSELSVRQENAVALLLEAEGFQRVQSRPIDLTGGLAPGEYSREVLVAGKKCDVPIGLRDGRLLLVECKVSNSETNSIKRLNHECGAKAALWRQTFGERAISAAVLAGVFKLVNLSDAQRNQGLTLFWERDLAPLAAFLAHSV